ncbi:SRPBCC family protein [Euzebya sp.]|uniref:SRPBCC family protein n=1 Tax=Euzebya sp. TaxID=1971409 RepID=UPI0035112975
MATDSVTESITIAADLPTVYDVVGDYESYPDWLDEFKSAEVLESYDDGWAKQVRFALSSMGLTVHMTLAYTYTDTRVDWRLVDGDMISKNDGSYDMEDNGDGTTTLTYTLEVQSNVPLPGMVRKRIAQKTVTDSLKAIKQRAES